MEYVTNENVFKYTVKNGKLFVHEGNIIMSNGRKYVYFKHDSSRKMYPRENVFGKVCSSGQSLWLTERNDKLAASIFIEYEEQKLDELRRQINIKTELINTLKEDLV